MTYNIHLIHSVYHTLINFKYFIDQTTDANK